eukprot:PhM_4_TR7051/c0_g1_i1/m.86551
MWSLSLILFLVLLLVGEYKHNFTLKCIAKTSASFSFIALCLLGDSLADMDFHIPPPGNVHGDANGFYRWTLVAFVLSTFGDIFLLKSGTLGFILGLGSFLCAHVAFVAAFIVGFALELDHTMLVGAAYMMPLTIGTCFWLLPSVPTALKPAVLAYISVISCMVATAYATGLTWLFAAAVIFALSDLTVARERFISPGFINGLIGLPLYYLAQWMFAICVP